MRIDKCCTHYQSLGCVWHAVMNDNEYEFDSSGGSLTYERCIPRSLDVYGVWIIPIIHYHSGGASYIKQTHLITFIVIASFP